MGWEGATNLLQPVIVKVKGQATPGNRRISPPLVFLACLVFPLRILDLGAQLWYQRGEDAGRAESALRGRAPVPRSRWPASEAWLVQEARLTHSVLLCFRYLWLSGQRQHPLSLSSDSGCGQDQGSPSLCLGFLLVHMGIVIPVEIPHWMIVRIN